jgi:transcriptional regulator with XRE-family HTH domain
MDYGKAIRLARNARRLTQKELAAKLEVDSSFVSLLESGGRNPSVETLEKLSEVLGIPLYLMMLLGSDQEDLRGISVEQASSLSRDLLDALLFSDCAGVVDPPDE